jgi:hypothetical protein
LRLNNEHPNCLKAIRIDNETSSGMPLLISFAFSMVLISSFLPRVCLNRMKLWNERATLDEMTRMMIDEHRTPRCFWADAVSTACYISN